MNNSVPDEWFEVWDRLSEFYLDTELDRKDYERIATSLAQSKYSLDELRDILDFEVDHACKCNMLCLAGEWSGFHPDWIMEHIAPRKDKRPRFTFGPIYRAIVRSYHWYTVAELIKDKRKDKSKVSPL